jgi:L-malate glycosyltransferase
MRLGGLRIALVGPLPPPEGGMANQTRQLGELLQGEGASVTLVQVNAPYRPPWVARIRGVRAAFRLAPYIVRLWRAADRVDIFHIMANSGWSWHLVAAPAVWVARLRGIPSVVNYRGGEAEAFLNRSGGLVTMTLRRANALVVPSGFLQRVFERWGLHSTIVPNIVDAERFRPGDRAQNTGGPHLVVPRNLEAIYDVGTALRAFAVIRAAWPGAKMTVAGSGPERQALHSLAAALGILDAVDFCGCLDRDRMARLYRTASAVINPSRVDNMPNSVLEAMASGAPVVSTNVGGLPFIVRDGVSGFLVPAGDHAAMATAVLHLLGDPARARQVGDAAMNDVQQYTWPKVKQRWAEVYAVAARKPEADALPI